MYEKNLFPIKWENICPIKGGRNPATAYEVIVSQNGKEKTKTKTII